MNRYAVIAAMALAISVTAVKAGGLDEILVPIDTWYPMRYQEDGIREGIRADIAAVGPDIVIACWQPGTTKHIGLLDFYHQCIEVAKWRIEHNRSIAGGPPDVIRRP